MKGNIILDILSTRCTNSNNCRGCISFLLKWYPPKPLASNRVNPICPLGHSGYRRYLYHQGNEQTTGGTAEAAAKPWLIPAGKYFAAHRPQGQHPRHSRYWSIKWYGGRGRLTKAWRPPLQCRQWSVHCLGDTNTCGIRNAPTHLLVVPTWLSKSYGDPVYPLPIVQRYLA